jgi:signal transduction histidine kinase
LDAHEAAGSQELSGIGKLFGDLRVRVKLMILHNIFFLVLTCAVYFSLIPAFEERISGAASRETSLVTQMFSEGKPLLRLPGMEIYEFQEGAAGALGIPGEVRQWLERNPGAVWRDPSQPYLYRYDPGAGVYRKLRTPQAFYDRMVVQAKWALLLALAATYILAVLLLEWVIMPKYVYRPIRFMLEADRAARRGDKENELIDGRMIPGDEIGQIMRSRNATVSQLTKQEEDLAQTLARLEEVAEDLKRKNHLLETAKRNLADQDRLVSLGMLSAGVAHELNTPLSVLSGSIEKLMETVEDHAAQERLARMQKVSDRLRKISEGLLDFARVRTHDLEPVPVRAMVQEAWELVAIDEKAADVHFTNLVRQDDIVIGNTDRLVQVFVNLLRNALSAVKSSGIILVESCQESRDGQSWVKVGVEDNGAGIPPDVLPHIFEAFVTSRLDARGTGLGLTVAEGIVHQHGGTIIAAIRPGGGARLEVRLPAARTEVMA